MKSNKDLSSKVLDYNESQEDVTPIYTDEEAKYMGLLGAKLENALQNRNMAREEFDWLTYPQYFEVNERGANSTIKPVKNKGETSFNSGTLRNKMMAVLNSIESLNLSPQIIAYNEYNLAINALGQALEDILEKIDEVNVDEELKALRQYEMFKQGTVFVETQWESKVETQKKITSGSYGDYKNVKWTTTYKITEAKPVRVILSGLSVVLGNMGVYKIENQPFIYTAEYVDYNIAEQIYGEFDMWKHVSRKVKPFNAQVGLSNYGWRLFDNECQDKVEILKYQSVPDNEFQIIINGTPMLPIGYPLPWGLFYSIDQQNLEPIRHDFAYGKSFIFKNKNVVSILDEMMKLGILKTQQSYLPALYNQSGRVISRATLLPGTINNTIRKGDVGPILEQQALGVTNSEFAMQQQLKSIVDANTVSNTFAGGKEAGGVVTATQVVELQRQSKLMMAQFILAASLLEQKLAFKQLLLVLQNWFDPEEVKLDEARNELERKYRTVSRERSIKGEGKGVRMVIPTNKKPTEGDIMNFEEAMKYKIGKPFRAIFINADALKQAKYTWCISVAPKEKKTSELNKVMLNEMLTTAMNLGLPLDTDYMAELFADAYDLDATRLINKSVQQSQQAGMGAEQLDNGQGMMPDPSNIKPNVGATMNQ